ncbi:MAG: methyltransferase [Armatimonadota bacterium]
MMTVFQIGGWLLTLAVAFWLGRKTAGRRKLRALLNGYQQTALLYVAAKLGLADLLAAGPKSSDALAETLGAHPRSLHRLLRGLVVLGVCAEEGNGRFRLTALGRGLQADAPGSQRGTAILNGEEYAGAWGGLLHSVMTGETAFPQVFGMSQWAHREAHPELNEYFNAELAQGTERLTGAVLAAYDFSRFGVVADVGGGHGSLLAAILNAHPAATGILFDLPHVVAGASPSLEAAGVADRCRLAGGSFFDEIPAGADAQILKSVIHDWDDAQSLAILRNCHRALKAGGTLLLIERIMPARAARSPFAVLLDLQMLALTGGRERREAEFRTLLAAAGFTHTRLIPTRAGLHIIEGVRAED